MWITIFSVNNVNIKLYYLCLLYQLTKILIMKKQSKKATYTSVDQTREPVTAAEKGLRNMMDRLNEYLFEARTGKQLISIIVKK